MAKKKSEVKKEVTCFTKWIPVSQALDVCEDYGRYLVRYSYPLRGTAFPIIALWKESPEAFFRIDDDLEWPILVHEFCEIPE